MARLCEEMQANIGEVRRAISLDRRIGPHFPRRGIWRLVLSKDIRAMISMGGDHAEMLLLKAVEEVNERQKEISLKK